MVSGHIFSNYYKYIVDHFLMVFLFFFSSPQSYTGDRQ